MGDIKRKRKKYEKPRKMFDSVRIKEENVLVNAYGLKNKREIWKAKSVTSKIRKRAKSLISKSDEEINTFIEKLKQRGILVENISDVLALGEKDILERRLQTVLFKKKLANTPRQARQLITHKYVLVNGRVVNTPSFWVSRDLEGQIELKPLKEKPKKEVAPVEEKAAEESVEESTEENEKEKTE
jgi:small subunit ribosomal protein S4